MDLKHILKVGFKHAVQRCNSASSLTSLFFRIQVVTIAPKLRELTVTTKGDEEIVRRVCVSSITFQSSSSISSSSSKASVDARRSLRNVLSSLCNKACDFFSRSICSSKRLFSRRTSSNFFCSAFVSCNNEHECECGQSYLQKGALD